MPGHTNKPDYRYQQGPSAKPTRSLENTRIRPETGRNFGLGVADRLFEEELRRPDGAELSDEDIDRAEPALNSIMGRPKPESIHSGRSDSGKGVVSTGQMRSR